MIINLTPHVVDIYAADAPGIVDQGAMVVTPLRSIPPSGTVARISEQVLRDGVPRDLPGAEAVGVIEVEYGHVSDLPEPRDGVWLVVSLPLALACPGRTDLLVPWRQVRNSKGTTVGCRGLARPV